MAQIFQVLVSSPSDENPLVPNARRKTIRKVINYLLSVAGGARRSTTTITGTHTMASASGTATISGASGTISVTVNGTTLSSTSGTDSARATALATAINADSTLAGIATASAAGAVVTVTAAAPGKLGNAITLAVSGTGITASGTRLANGAGTTLASFSI